MARTAKTAAKTTGRKPGRPSNAERAARVQASNENFLRIVAQAASSAAEGAVRAALSGGTVTSIGIPSASANGSGSATTGSKTKGGSPAAKSPGRNPNPESNRFKAFALYSANAGKMERKDIVNKMVEDLGLKKNVANTYFHEAQKKAGHSTGRTRKTAKVAKAA